MRTRKFWPTPGALLALGLACSTRALADDAPDSEAAEALFRDGRDAVKKGDFAVACPKFEASERLEPARGTLLNLALCEEGWGHIAAARAHLRELLELPDLDAERRAIARKHADALDEASRGAEPAGALETSPERSPTTEGAGARLRTAASTAPRPSPPGEPSGVRATSAAPPSVEPAESTSPHVAVYLLGGLGLVSLATCAVTGILVIDRADTVNAHCPNKQCDDEGLAAAASGRTLSAVSTATFGVGVALTALSVYFLLEPKTATRSSKIAVAGSYGGARVAWVREF